MLGFVLARALRLRVALAFLAVYLIWCSTYLAIRFVIESLPPFFMAGTRFVVAGAILYAFALLRGAARELKGHWGSAVVIGGSDVTGNR